MSTLKRRALDALRIAVLMSGGIGSALLTTHVFLMFIVVTATVVAMCALATVLGEV